MKLEAIQSKVSTYIGKCIRVEQINGNVSYGKVDKVFVSILDVDLYSIKLYGRFTMYNNSTTLKYKVDTCIVLSNTVMGNITVLEEYVMDNKIQSIVNDFILNVRHELSHYRNLLIQHYNENNRVSYIGRVFECKIVGTGKWFNIKFRGPSIITSLKNQSIPVRYIKKYMEVNKLDEWDSGWKPKCNSKGKVISDVPELKRFKSKNSMEDWFEYQGVKVSQLNM